MLRAKTDSTMPSKYRKIYQDVNLEHFQSGIKPPWRNRLARSAVNRKVGGSSPPGGEQFLCDLTL